MKRPPDDDRRSRWDQWREYRSAPKKPPPEHGIKVKKAGTTWWGQRWIEALERVLGGDAGRLGRGRTYARAGRTHDLTVHGGKVQAQVTGTRPQPYEVSIELVQLSDAQWAGAIAAMAAQAQFAAQLLGGEMPQAIDDAFRAAGCSLFPEQDTDLETDCSCPDWGNPCKHVAATHYVLGEALDRDPFLLFELRGRSKTAVLEALRRARTGSSSKPSPALPATTRLDAAHYDQRPASLPPLEFSFDAPSTHAAVLRQLGAPATWNEDLSPADALAPLVQRAAEAARRIALSETQGEEAARAEQTPTLPATPRRKRAPVPPTAGRAKLKAATQRTKPKAAPARTTTRPQKKARS